MIGGDQQRQKRVAVAGAVVLLALLAIQGPRTLKQLRGPSAPVTEQAVAAADTQPAPRPSNPVVLAASRRLVGRIDRFPPKDPFVPQPGSTPTPPPSPSARPASSPGASLLSGSGRSYAESGTRATSSGPSILSAAGAPVETPRNVEKGANGSTVRYTVILGSIRLSAGRRAAESQARRFRRAGLPGVGVLVSARYRSLRAGYYVVYSGSYATAADAKQAAATARSKVRGARARPLRPRDGDGL